MQYRYELEMARSAITAAGHLIARSDADDDVLAEFPDGRFAIVHLTWSDDIRSQAQVTSFTTLEDAFAAMRRDGTALRADRHGSW